MMKKEVLIVSLVVLLVLPFALAERVGDVCEFAASGDTRCNPSIDILCIDNICTEYTDSTALYCKDPDNNNPDAKSTVDFKFRTDTGAFVEGSVTDECYDDGTFVITCDNCQVREFICSVTTSGYDSILHDCSYGCHDGACLPEPEPVPEPEPETIEGNACDFAVYNDTQCDVENLIFCVDDICTKLDKVPKLKCIDYDGLDETVKDKLVYTYRNNDGELLSGTLWDGCSENNVLEYACLDPMPSKGPNFGTAIFECSEGCSQGVCIATTPIEEIEVTDEVLLQAIEDWSNGELGDTEEENDQEIQKIIEKWKK